MDILEFEYLDLTAKYGDVFGSNIPIIVNNSSSREFNFSIKKILYEYSSMTFDGRMDELSIYDDLSDFGNLRDQFVREVKAVNYQIEPVIKPTESQGCWYCTCGSVNYCENEKCGKCGIDKEKLFSFLDIEYLSEKNKTFLENEENKRNAETERIALKKEKMKRNIKRAVIVFSAFAIICTAIYFLITYLIVPHVKYKHMLNMIEEGKYEEGYRSFLEIRNIPLTSDEIELAYDFGNKCIEGDAYEYAMNFFILVSEYENSNEQYKKAAYFYGRECLENDEFEKAMNAFEKANDYEDAAKQKMEATYMYGLQCLNNKDYTEAIIYFKRAGEQGNKYADMRMKEAKYEYVKQNLNVQNETTYHFLVDLMNDNYKDADNIYNDLYN